MNTAGRSAFDAVKMASCRRAMQSRISIISHFSSGPRAPARTVGCWRDAPPGSWSPRR